MLRYLADEDLDIRIVRGVLRAAPEIEFVRAQDVQLGSHSDDLVLIHAANDGQLVVTHDVATMTAAAIDRIHRGEMTPGPDCNSTIAVHWTSNRRFNRDRSGERAG